VGLPSLLPFAKEMKTLTRESISETERTVNRLHHQVHTTFANRDKSEKERKAWEEATSVWHSSDCPTDKLWREQFRADLRASVPYAIEEAILFLEVDPWYFRSGYLKQRLIRGLKAATLKNRDRIRLWNVCWNAAAGKNRQEFRSYCSLAAIVGDAELIRLLEEIPEHRNIAADGKFRYMAAFLRENTKKANKPEMTTPRKPSD